MAGRLILTVGLPGSGKSTWAKAEEAKDPENAIRVNRDDIRERLYGAEYHNSAPDPLKEKKVSQVREEEISRALKEGKTVIADDTNLNPRFIGASERIAKANGASMEQKLFDVPPEECLRRNKARGAAGGREVPESVIKAMAARAYKNGHLMGLEKDSNGRWKMAEVNMGASKTTDMGVGRFHISPDGTPRPCGAKVRCRYAEGGVEPPHYSTEAEARRAFENSMKGDSLAVLKASATVSKGSSPDHPRLDAVVSPEAFQKALDRGLISEREHPDDPNLRVYSYTKTVQFSGLWTRETLLARGLIMDVSEGLENATIRARGIRKFFTVDQMESGDWTKIKLIDDDEGVVVGEGVGIALDEPAHVADKLDGALGVLYKDPGGRYRISTKGSFDSMEALEGSKFMKSYENQELTRVIEEEYRGRTPLFEIITPEHRHPVDYGDKADIVFLGSVSNQTGEWRPATKEEPLAQTFEISESQPAGTLREALETPYRENTEGFVVTVGEGAEQKLYKVKPPEYHALRRVFYGLTNPKALKDRTAALTYEEFSKIAAGEASLGLGVDLETASPSTKRIVAKAEETIRELHLAPITSKMEEVRVRAKVYAEQAGGSRADYARLVQETGEPGFYFAALDEIEGGSVDKLFRAVRDSVLKRL